MIYINPWLGGGDDGDIHCCVFQGGRLQLAAVVTNLLVNYCSYSYVTVTDRFALPDGCYNTFCV